MPLTFEDEPQESDDIAYPCILLYGPPKTGKSGAAVKGAKSPTVYLNADVANALRYPRRQVPRGTLKVIDFKHGVLDAMTSLERAVQAQPEKIDRVVIDPLGEVYRRLLAEVSGGAVSPTLPNYQTAGFYLERLLRAVAEAPVTSVFVAHEFPVQNEGTNEVEKLMWMGTKSNSEALSQKIMGLVDVIAYTGVVEQDGGRAYLSTLVNAKGRRGGDRWDVLGDVQPTDVGAWVDIIRGSTSTTASSTEPTPITTNEGQQAQEDQAA